MAVSIAPIELQAADRHGHIVKNAEPFAMIGIRVMESAADIRRPAVAQRALTRKNRAARGEPAGVHQLQRVRNFQSQDFCVGKRARF